MIGQRLEVRQGQGLVITPQLQQAIKLLQLSNLELEDFVEAELERNPLLQRDEPEGDGAEAVETAPAASADAEMTFGDGVGGEAASALDAGSDDVYGDAAPGERTSDRMTDEAQPGLSDWSSAGKGGQVFEGEVTAVEPQVDPATRNFKVQATLANGEYNLRPGAFAHVGFDTGDARKVVVVPQTAISFNPYGNAVYVIQEVQRAAGEKDMQGNDLTGKKLVVRQRFVKTGATRGDLIAVTDGLKPGDEVATSGLLKLRNDAEVTINNTVQPSAEAKPQAENR